MRALVTGPLGQDGSYLVEQLVADGHDVWGMVRRSNVNSPAELLLGDLLDQDSLERVLHTCRPDVVFNLAAVTSPGGSWGTAQPPLLAETTGVGVIRLLDAMLQFTPDARLVHASSSAVYDPYRYGLYGAAKLLAHQAVVGYRDRLHASNAVLFSHTSPRQDGRFLARRICSTIARIAAGSPERLVLGDIQSQRDWGYAPDYCKAMRLIAGEDKPGDWAINTGVPRSVWDVANTALKTVGLAWDDAVTIDPALPYVPDETPATDPPVTDLGWRPETAFTDMIAELTV